MGPPDFLLHCLQQGRSYTASTAPATCNLSTQRGWTSTISTPVCQRCGQQIRNHFDLAPSGFWHSFHSLVHRPRACATSFSKVVVATEGSIRIVSPLQRCQYFFFPLLVRTKFVKTLLTIAVPSLFQHSCADGEPPHTPHMNCSSCFHSSQLFTPPYNQEENERRHQTFCPPDAANFEHVAHV